MAITAIDALVAPVTIAVTNRGPAGVAATIQIGTVTDVAHDEEASVINSGTANAAILDFELRQGNPGDAGTIEIGTVTTVGHDQPSTVTNIGTPHEAVLDFELRQGNPATIAIGSVTVVASSSPPSVVNVGTATDAVLDFEIPQGVPGINAAGEWDENEEYTTDSLVTFGGQGWIALRTTMGEEPGEEPGTGGPAWLLYIEKGDPGNLTGPDGGVADGEIMLFDGSTGSLAKGSGKQIGDFADAEHGHSHFSDTNNPHSVTKEQVGLGNVTDDVQAKASTTVSAGTGLTGGGDLSENRTLSVDKASAANIRAGTADKVITADGIGAATELTAPSGASNWAPDWNSFVVADWAVTANRTLSNPTNVVAGTTRYVFIRATSGTRTISFGSNFKGDLPTLNDVTTTKWYLLALVAYSSTHIVVSSVVALS